MLNFQFFTSKTIFGGYLEIILVATQQLRPLIFRRYVAEQVIWTFQTNLKFVNCFGCTPPFLIQNNASKMLNFQGLFISKKKLWWVLCARSVHSLPENMKPNKVRTFKICQIYLNCFRPTPSFLLYKNSFFTSKRNFGGYFE